MRSSNIIKIAALRLACTFVANQRALSVASSFITDWLGIFRGEAGWNLLYLPFSEKL